jgi:hypothetical protein
VGDVNALSAKMAVVAKDARLRHRMGRTAACLVEGQHDDRYAEDFETFVRGALALDRTTGLRPAFASLLGRAISAAQFHPTKDLAPLVSTSPMSDGRAHDKS